jgi:hypothetical protein
MCLMSVMTSMSTAPITEPSFDETARICAIPAVVDTRRVLRARETTARGVPGNEDGYTSPQKPGNNHHDRPENRPKCKYLFGRMANRVLGQ